MIVNYKFTFKLNVIDHNLIAMGTESSTLNPCLFPFPIYKISLHVLFFFFFNRPFIKAENSQQTNQKTLTREVKGGVGGWIFSTTKWDRVRGRK